MGLADVGVWIAAALFCVCGVSFVVLLEGTVSKAQEVAAHLSLIES